VHLFADHHRQRRRSEQAVRLDIPSLPAEQRVPGGGQGAEVGHGGTGHEADADFWRQAEQCSEPPPAGFLKVCRGRRCNVKNGILVPSPRQVAGCQRRRQRAARDKAEIPRSGAGYGGGRTDVI
jgi:hypothetical protein